MNPCPGKQPLPIGQRFGHLVVIKEAAQHGWSR